MPDPTDFDEGPPTEPEVADELAEDLAIDGPPDAASEVTPTLSVEDACGLCRLVPVKRDRYFKDPPTTFAEAWALGACTSTWAGDWTWCQLRGLLSVAGVLTDFNRRKTPGRPPGGVERRRLAALKSRA